MRTAMNWMMRAGLVVALLCAGCGSGRSSSTPCGDLLGARGMVGCRIAQGEQPRLDGKLTGFLVSSDKPNHFSVGWIDSLDSHSAFAGTISVDGTIDSRATHGHTGTEMVRFDGANQISFQSVPGNTLDGVDLTTTSDTIYLDGYLNGSRLATAVRLVGPYYSEYTDESRMGEADTNRDPVAFSATQRP